MRVLQIFLYIVSFLYFCQLRGQDTFADNFQSVSYANSDGSELFLGNWTETGEGTNPSNGRMRIVGDRLRFQNLDTRYITRNLDLSPYNDVTLTLDYDRDVGDESMDVQLFNGSSFITIATISGTNSLSYDLAPAEISASSAIRFVATDGVWDGSNDRYYIDNVLFTAEIPDQPPLVVGSGNQVYCPGASMPVAQSITITDPDDTSTTAVYIQISGGYVNGEDLLTLTGSHPSITPTWDAVQGELTLQGPATYIEFEAAVLATEFSSSSASPSGIRQFSITVGEANYLPSTSHYYEFVSDPNISWTDAEIAASNRTYFGLQGYLATLTSQAEADFSGSQAQGVGWIGATDAAVEGEWRWVTGPEAGTQFWSGAAGGTELTFAFWNSGEPNDYPDNGIDGQENYAHITDPSVTSSPGSWNDLPNVTATSGAYSAQGYVVEYGGMVGDPPLNITATTTLNISLCNVITNKRITYRVNRN
ncbi:C-type lectin domain-containing protein [Maribacter halichondriae]|uniref:C-type lectin domain-containing protein n=1 Tax=Maribacter halichondriae TaxID=2980554 RepID=UPI00235955C2|nr:C-type lectin domain-containing protein [Maribacter sp. Hal144]